MIKSRYKRSPLDVGDIIARFHRAVNMTAPELRKWLATDEAKKSGFFRPGETRSVGYHSGQRIVAILENGGPRDDADLSHMVKVVGYVARHTKQWPAGDVRHTTWRYSLMNWGHDPLKRRH